ncbi:biotin--[acetyl-CoA-carboxylase] ligase [uncultured Croceicoccus sp.]|uniref:biotin--[acetyl-CoA-carboxylase] ligase n=1 Tax=uncultured Croceicoccus sp. TaxID=1295329 RepID=UPI00261A8AEE|nr:biotin--[acetyl-CoA-carboxylase] ligase [uncultured Croceicoccus sp.]
MSDRVVRSPIEVVSSIGSTNTELLARCGRGEAVREGSWLVADRQTAGRGRLGREWYDGAGNFMGSTVVALNGGDPAAHTLALVAALAVYETIAAALADTRRLMLKWPNDVLWEGAKIAGILLERQGDTVVAGIGVNLARAPQIDGMATASLADMGVHVARDALAQELAHQFAVCLALWRGSGLVEIVSRWIARGPARGTLLSASVPGEGAVTGRYAGLGPDGSLRLSLADGRERAIYAGEVAMIAGEGDD